MKTYHVCWSGGLDSTFIVTQLSQYPVRIRSFYVRGQTFRQSEPQELAAIAAIRDLLSRDKRTMAEILEPEVVAKDDSRIKDREIVHAHRRLYTHLLTQYKENHHGKLPPAGSQQIYADGAFLSPQYVACASLAKFYGENIEIGLLRDDFEGNMPIFQSSLMETVLDAETGRKLLRLSENTSNEDLYCLFKDLRFPVAGQGMYKRDVWQWYEDNDYSEIRAHTNFCQAPVMDEYGRWEPCGTCTACIGVIHEGVLAPSTGAGLARYRDYVENHEREPERFRLKGFEMRPTIVLSDSRLGGGKSSYHCTTKDLEKVQCAQACLSSSRISPLRRAA